MYPFERFTAAAQETLTVAQQEASRAYHSYIGTEHIVLALVSQRGTVAGETLARLGVTYEPLRHRIDAILGQNERVVIQQIIPTSRVKKVIELAFEEARRVGVQYVSTEHLLLALLIDGEGIAAHVLVDSGASLESVRATATQVREAGIHESPRGSQPSVAPPTRAYARVTARHASVVVAGAEAEAARDLADEFDDIHVLRHLLNRGDRRVLSALRRLGVDPEELRKALLPPERVVELRRSVRDAVSAKQSAAAQEDYQGAEAAKQKELQLRRELAEAQQEWEQSMEGDS